jgi:outer membrane protein assembly factor BamA
MANFGPKPLSVIMRLVPSKILMIVLLSIVTGKNFAQQDTLERKSSFIGFPVLFYLPETRWGFGAAGIYNFYVDKEDSISPPSQLQFGFAYTQNKQVLLYAPVRLYWQERNWQAYGQVGYYKYSYFFFGVGNENTAGTRESYAVDFPRFRLNVMRKLAPNLYGGLRYWYENFNITGVAEGGLLDTANVAGAQGGVTSGPGVIMNYDSRDNVYFASSGLFVEATYQSNNAMYGSDFVFDRYRLDVRTYVEPFEKHILAFQAFLDVNKGDPPFSQMAMLGGVKRMRGFYEGRYRDKSMFLFQSEYRPRIWKAIGGSVFFNAGMVGSEVGALSMNNLRTTYGAGLRYMFDEEKKINVRFDAAFGKGTNTFYFTVGEAF